MVLKTKRATRRVQVKAVPVAVIINATTAIVVPRTTVAIHEAWESLLADGVKVPESTINGPRYKWRFGCSNNDLR